MLPFWSVCLTEWIRWNVSSCAGWAQTLIARKISSDKFLGYISMFTERTPQSNEIFNTFSGATKVHAYQLFGSINVRNVWFYWNQWMGSFQENKQISIVYLSAISTSEMSASALSEVTDDFERCSIRGEALASSSIEYFCGREWRQELTRSQAHSLWDQDLICCMRNLSSKITRLGKTIGRMIWWTRRSSKLSPVMTMPAFIQFLLFSERIVCASAMN